MQMHAMEKLAGDLLLGSEFAKVLCSNSPNRAYKCILFLAGSARIKVKITTTLNTEK